MKKTKNILITILFISLISSCSKDTDENETAKAYFNPPSWILGSWIDVTSATWSQSGGFKFTEDNIYEISAEGEEFINFKEGMSPAIDTGSIEIEEIISNDAYTIKIWSFGALTLSYTFINNKNSTIIYKLTPSIDIILTKQ